MAFYFTSISMEGKDGPRGPLSGLPQIFIDEHSIPERPQYDLGSFAINDQAESKEEQRRRTWNAVVSQHDTIVYDFDFLFAQESLIAYDNKRRPPQ
jgi:hypothetical protein